MNIYCKTLLLLEIYASCDFLGPQLSKFKAVLFHFLNSNSIPAMSCWKKMVSGKSLL